MRVVLDRVAILSGSCKNLQRLPIAHRTTRHFSATDSLEEHVLASEKGPYIVGHVLLQAYIRYPYMNGCRMVASLGLGPKARTKDFSGLSVWKSEP